MVMVRRAVLAGLTAGMCVVGIAVSCSKDSNPAGHQPSELIGTWAGLTTKPSFMTDSFTIVLNFANATNYTLTRFMVKYASSASGVRDSAWETGTWAINGENAVLTSTQCKLCQSWETQLNDVLCDTIPKTINIAISNNQWNITMKEWKNGDPITYPTTRSY
jgi:hypothetical protein